MTGSPLDTGLKPVLDRGLRLQWEEVQKAHVLLYPEGMIRLNSSAGEILKRCDGVATIEQITASLEQAFDTQGLAADIADFIGMAVEKRWLCLKP